MANNAATTYNFKFENNAKSNEFYEKVKDCKTMYEIAQVLELGDGSYRAEVIDIWVDINNNVIGIYFDAAWDWQPDFYHKMVDKYENIQTDFICEEEGCGVFVTSSFDVFPCRFELHDENDYWDEFATEESLFKAIEKITNVKVSSVEEAQKVIDKFNENVEDEYDTLYLNVFRQLGE